MPQLSSLPWVLSVVIGVSFLLVMFALMESGGSVQGVGGVLESGVNVSW